MNNLNEHLKAELLAHGADVVSFGALTELPPEARDNLPVGVCVAVKYPKEVIRGITMLPTADYFSWYNRLNERLDMLVTLGAAFLQCLGYRAVAQTRARVGMGEDNDSTDLPHKTVATRAGLGWIGKCALLVTKEYGSMIRLSSILTDAPLKTAQSVNTSRCGDCTACTHACPGKAVTGKLWHVGMPREAFFDAAACREAARERARLGFGGGATICGKCIEVCPYTQKYLKAACSERFD